MRAIVTALFLALSGPEDSLRSRAAARLGRAQIVLVEKLRTARRKVAIKRARFRWER